MRVFLAEDSLPMRKRLVEIINQIPQAEVVGVTTGMADSIAGVSLFSPDVLVLDIHLRDGNAIEIIKALGEAKPRLTILITSGPTTAFNAIARTLGINHVFDKATDMPEMIGMLKAHATQLETPPELNG